MLPEPSPKRRSSKGKTNQPRSNGDAYMNVRDSETGTDEQPNQAVGPQEYRPNKSLGIVFAVIFVVTALVLVWVGVVLRPDDRAAMDGLTRILFTVIPIRLFSWTAAAVFAFLGVRIARRAIRAEPTLIIAEADVTFPTGKVIPWSQVTSAEVDKNDLLVIVTALGRAEQTTPNARLSWLRWLGRGQDPNQVVLSSFDLGADPGTVAALLQSKIGA